MSGEEFAAWRKSHGMSVPQMAEFLGLSIAVLHNYRTGATPVPQVVEMALATWNPPPNALIATYIANWMKP